MTSVPRRTLNEAVTRFWSLAAPTYDFSALQRWAYRPPQDEVITLLRDHQSRRIVDVACGTGILADRIQRELKTEQVYGVDMSDGMLRQAMARSGNVQWLRAPAEKLPFDDGALDAVVTTSAFHFFDQAAALREFRRVLQPGGIAAVATLAPHQPPLLSRFIDSSRSPAHNPAPDEMRALFTDAGFEVVDQHRVHRPLWTRMFTDRITVGVRSA